MRRSVLLAAACLVLLASPASALRIFAKTGAVSGSFGGLAVADASCQSQADAASLGGSFRALLSTSTIDAADRVEDAVWTLPSGATVANSKADLLDGSILVTVTEDSFGNATATGKWTGSTSAGISTGNHCTSWTASFGPNGTSGAPLQTDGRWLNNADDSCLQSRAWYCVEFSPPATNTPTVTPTETPTVTPTNTPTVVLRGHHYRPPTDLRLSMPTPFVAVRPGDIHVPK